MIFQFSFLSGCFNKDKTYVSDLEFTSAELKNAIYSASSCECMEELRAIIVDRFVLTLINLKQITPDDFIKKESEGILMTDSARKLFLTEWQKRKQEEINHCFLGEKIKFGLIPYAQALILSRYLRNEINDYVPFFRR